MGVLEGGSCGAGGRGPDEPGDVASLGYAVGMASQGEAGW